MAGYLGMRYEDGTVKEAPYVTIDGKKYEVTMPEFEGGTALSAENINDTQKALTSEWRYEEIIPANTEITNGYIISMEKGWNYVVGANQLEVYWDGIKLVRKDGNTSDGQYSENGEDGETSISISIYRTDDDGNYTIPHDIQVLFVIKGGWNVT